MLLNIIDAQLAMQREHGFSASGHRGHLITESHPDADRARRRQSIQNVVRPRTRLVIAAVAGAARLLWARRTATDHAR